MKALLLTLMASVAAAGVAVLPLVSYSSGSGLLYGAILHAGPEGVEGPEISVMAYGTARGGQYESFGVRIPVGGGAWFASACHEQLLNHDFFGWGNWGDPDESLEYDRESDVISIGHTRTFGPFEARAGAEARHSSVFDREEGDLWGSLPDRPLTNGWTAGPSVELSSRSYPGPAWGNLRARFDWQGGGGKAYWRTELERTACHPIGGGFLLALRNDVAYHHGAGDTQIPFLPFLGPAQLLREYAGDRFSGDWLTVANLELRRRLFGLMDDPETDDPLILVGAALFADAGQASETLSGMRWDRWHPDGGIGFYATLRGMTLRVDAALLSPEGFRLNMRIGGGF
ncbi:MAG TPA: hypothetical protein PLF04_03665 [Candidatus Fermentibacter daniensis]|nr:hypothetical protein [Candidatus Fermentibacter daniensis]HPH39085.1 hypothetical protein [Candidatus Fermentibacter daniensis]HPN61940.1 hypothetical protein [Candidatus Fermentibacter daniensis]